ncbi:hypothetical protein Taro_053005 [Colocasia esculenta]|uniref:Uncharacterized protein n=1 Tax=Colocasia esculenta TaxID=4460 RepID=A0A843XLC3_COLES|nr:hypothetical protein [Colocasia esculenta]
MNLSVEVKPGVRIEPRMLTWEKAWEITWERDWESWACSASVTCVCIWTRRVSIIWARRVSIVWARRDSKPDIVFAMKPIMSLGEVPRAPTPMLNALVCEAELEAPDNTLLVSILCPKPYTWPFFGAPDAATHTSGSNYGCSSSPAYFSIICWLYDSCNKKLTM